MPSTTPAFRPQAPFAVRMEQLNAHGHRPSPCRALTDKFQLHLGRRGQGPAKRTGSLLIDGLDALASRTPISPPSCATSTWWRCNPILIKAPRQRRPSAAPSTSTCGRRSRTTPACARQRHAEAARTGRTRRQLHGHAGQAAVGMLKDGRADFGQVRVEVKIDDPKFSLMKTWRRASALRWPICSASASKASPRGRQPGDRRGSKPAAARTQGIGQALKGLLANERQMTGVRLSPSLPAYPGSIPTDPIMAASDILFADVSKLLFSDVRDIVKLAGKEAGGKMRLRGSRARRCAAEKVASELAERLTKTWRRSRPAEVAWRCSTLRSRRGTALAALELATETAPLPLPAAAMSGRRRRRLAASSHGDRLRRTRLSLQDKVGGPMMPGNCCGLPRCARCTPSPAARYSAYRGPCRAVVRLMEADAGRVLGRRDRLGRTGQGRGSGRARITSPPCSWPRRSRPAAAEPALAAAHALHRRLAPTPRIEAATLRARHSCRFLIATDSPRLPSAGPRSKTTRRWRRTASYSTARAATPDRALLAAGGEAAPLHRKSCAC